MDSKAINSRRLAAGTPRLLAWGAGIGAIALLTIAAFIFRDRWLPPTRQWTVTMVGAEKAQDQEADAHNEHDHSGHDHAGHDEANSLELSSQARKNIDLQTGVVKLQNYMRRMSVPSIVMGRPGRSQVEVTAPLGGRVTRVYPIEGEAVQPGRPLFDLRLTHEELVQAQSDLLRSAEQLDVEQREIARLQEVVNSGAVPGKQLLEREYEKQKLVAVLNAQRQSLSLHGLTEEQINNIVDNRQLVQGVTVVAPEHAEHGNQDDQLEPFTVRSLQVRPGQYVDAGAPLCQLMDYGELYIQGRAFEHDSDELLRAAQQGWEVEATEEGRSGPPVVIRGLTIVYVDNEIEPESRALHFYVRLRNDVVHSSRTKDGHQFLTWRFKPGQRMQLRVPVEEWTDRIVLPVDAVARDGAETYVFQQNGDHFDRVPVHVEYQDQVSAVIANDGSLFPGATVAMSGAHQLQMALKNKAGGGIDPHAGHNH